MVTILITNYQDLLNLSNNKNVNAGDVYELTNDIVCEDRYFPPIKKFPATFDGKNFKITGYKSKENGLFQSTVSTSVIKNVTMDVKITSMSTTKNIYVGGLVGLNLGEIANCNISGEIDSKNIVGMVCGCNNRLITNSLSSGTVRSIIGGGLVGLNSNTVQRCYSTVNLDVQAKVRNHSGCILGGLVAYNQKNVNNCYSSGQVNSVDKAIAGGFVGRNKGGITNSFCTSDVSCLDSKETTKGFCGEILQQSSLTNCYAYELQVINNKVIAYNLDLAGTGTSNHIMTLSQITDTAHLNGVINKDLTPAAFSLSTSNMPQVYCKDSTSEFVPNQTSERIKNVLGISNVTQLRNISNDLTRDYKLLNDIDCTEIADFVLLASYQGEFDGNGYAIYNFKSTQGSLFTSLAAQAVVKNVSLDCHLSLSNKQHNGGLVSGENLGTVTNCCVKGELNVVTGASTQYVGGIVSVNKGTIESSYSQMKIHISGTELAENEIYAGGICGGNDHQISRCYSDSQLIYMNNSEIKIAGLVGYPISTPEKNKIDNCLATSSIIAAMYPSSMEPFFICAGGWTGANVLAYEHMVMSINGRYYIAKNFEETKNIATIDNLKNTTWLTNLFGDNFQYESEKLPLLLHSEDKTKLIRNQQSEISTYVYLYDQTSLDAINGLNNYKLIKDITTTRTTQLMTDFNYCFNGGGYTLQLTSRLCHTLGINGVIKNLYIDAGVNELNITSFEVCKFALDNKGTIQNCSASANIKIDYENAGLIGSTNPEYAGLICSANNGSIISCYANLNLNVSRRQIDHTSYLGGISGINNSMITACYTRGEIKVTSRRVVEAVYISGISGMNANTGAIKSCMSQMTLKAKMIQVEMSGICLTESNNNVANVSNCFFSGTFDSNIARQINLITDVEQKSKNCVAYQYAGAIFMPNFGKEYLYQSSRALYSDSYRVIDNVTLKDTNYMSSLLNQEGIYYIVSSDNYPILKGTPGQTSVPIPTKSNMIVICNDFKHIRKDCNYHLANHIVWKESEQVPLIQEYSGILDGGNFEIQMYKSEHGLFGSITSDAQIKNLKINVVEVNIRQLDQTIFGILANKNAGHIENCCVKSGVLTNSFVQDEDVFIGVLVGENNGTIQKCYSKTRIRLSNLSAFVGGLVGLNTGTIMRCYFGWEEISVQGGNKFCIGGLVSTNRGSISDCYSGSQLLSLFAMGIQDCYMGGLIGRHESGLIQRCFCTARISVLTRRDNLRAGLLAGYNSSSTAITSTYTGGSIVAVQSEESTYSGFIAKVERAPAPRKSYVHEEALIDDIPVEENILLSAPASAVSKDNVALKTWWDELLNAQDDKYFETKNGRYPTLVP